MADTIPTQTIGEILEEEFLRPLEMTPYRLSKELHVSTSTVLDFVHGKRRLRRLFERKDAAIDKSGVLWDD